MQFKKKLLVFPTSRSIREYIQTQKEFNTLLPSIITIDELFKRVLVFKNKKLIDEEQRFLYLNQAVKSIDLKELGISNTFSKFIKQSDYIYRFFLELASENISIETLLNEDTYDFYSEHLNILKQIRKNYLEILKNNQAIDRINMIDSYSLNRDFLKRYNEIEIKFEGYFTSFEFEIVKQISELVTLKIDFTYNRYNKKSIEKFIKLGFDLKVGYKYQIDFTKKNILSEQKSVNKNEEVVIKGFSSRINQIAFIKKAISDYVSKGIDPSKIALILPDESFSSTICLFDKEGYFNYAMGLNIYTSKLYRYIDAIYLYLNDEEVKNIVNLEFLNVDKQLIDTLFKVNWNKTLSKELFEKIIDYLIEKEDNKELLEKFQEVVYKFYKLIFSYSEKILLKDAYKIFHQKVAKISLDDVNSGKITVMGLLESRMINFEAVIICDFVESLIPKRSLKDKFLSTSLKDRVKLPTTVDRENLQKYYYERLISNSKNISISYVKNDNEQISRFAYSLFDKQIDEILYDNQYKHILYTNKQLKHFEEKLIFDIDLSKQIWSASSLKEFLECKRKYYLHHILKIKEHDISLKPKGYEVGNIVHKSLENYYKQNIRTYDKLVEIFNQEKSLNPFLNLDLQIWKRKFKQFIEVEERRFEQGYKIIDLEKSFLIDFNEIKLRGTIDRIDFKDNSYFVIDYKTSSNLKVDSKRNYEKAVDFQLEFYYLALQELFNSSNIKTFYYDLYNIKLLEELVLEEKLKLLEQIFSNFKTKTVNFEKCDNNQTCQYCSYKTICNRD